MEAQAFDRIEKKYLITKQAKKELLKTIKKHLKTDEYHKSEVYNIYFDNDNFDLIIQSIDRPTFKEKLRARSYGGYDRVFFEIKTKLKGKDANLGYKRRIMVTRQEYEKIVAGETTLLKLVSKNHSSKENQIAKEIDYLIKHFKLKPRILVYYKRESYKGENSLRITFDERLKFRQEELNFEHEKHDKIYFKDDRNIIMEIKAHGGLPIWLVELLSNNHIYPQQFSKIGRVYERIRKEKNV